MLIAMDINARVLHTLKNIAPFKKELEIARSHMRNKLIKNWKSLPIQYFENLFLNF